MFNSGHKIGNYTLISKLGTGGFGEVWLAEKQSQFIRKKVAVKLPHEDQVDFDAVRREAELWEQASGHPNVLPIIDADVYDGQVVIVSEYAEGGSLSDLLRREGKFSVRAATEMALGILKGLEFLHGKLIIHRDIKPQNILLQGNTPRLADFGISRGMSTSTISSVVVGTDSYMAPEAFDGKRSVQTDIWSVGVVFYQMLKGTLPFPQDHPSERMFAVLTKEFAPLPYEVPENFRYIVQRSLAKDVLQRYRSAREMREDVEAVLSNTSLPSRRSLPLNPFHGEQETIQRRFHKPELPPTMPVGHIRQEQYSPYPQARQNPFFPAAASPLAARHLSPFASTQPQDFVTAGSRALAGFCYLGNVLCLPGVILSIVAIFSDKTNKFTRFHAFQSLLLSGLYFVNLFGFVLLTNIIRSAIKTSSANTRPLDFLDVPYMLGSFTLLGLLIFGAVQGFRGKMSKIPIIGNLAEKWSTPRLVDTVDVSRIVKIHFSNTRSNTLSTFRK